MIKPIADPLITDVLAELLVLFPSTNVRALGEITGKNMRQDQFVLNLYKPRTYKRQFTVLVYGIGQQFYACVMKSRPCS